MRKPDPLELEVGMAVIFHEGGENPNQVLCKSSKCSKLLSHPLKGFIQIKGK